MPGSIKRLFKNTAAAITAISALAVPNVSAQEFETLTDMAKYTWETLPHAGELEGPGKAAIQMLRDVAPDMAPAFENSVLLFRPPPDGRLSAAHAQFLVTGENNDIPVIIIYNDPRQSRFQYAYLTLNNEGDENIPDYDTFMSVHIALSLGNEIAHLRQYEAAPDAFQHMTSTDNPAFCTDTMALEHASGTLMIRTALQLYDHFQTLPAGTAHRMTIALNDALYFSGFTDFITYAQNPADDTLLKSFEKSRHDEYAARKNCVESTSAPLSHAAQMAVSNTLRPL